jgi:GH24 family phage-related lysozyme (muramidase)
MRFLLFILLAGVLSAQTQLQYDAHIQRFEGYRPEVYTLHGRAHVGWGHLIVGNPSLYQNLSRADHLSIYRSDFNTAYRAALAEVPSFYSHPVEVRILIVALAYNTGQRGLRDFRGFRSALSHRDYLSAARELRSSKWASQVGRNRSQAYIQTLTSAAFVIPSSP